MDKEEEIYGQQEAKLALPDMSDLFNKIDLAKNDHYEPEEISEDSIAEDNRTEAESLSENEEDEENAESLEFLADNEEQPQKKKKNHWALRKKLYQTRDENERLRQENLQLKQQTNLAVDTGIYQATQKATLELEKSKEKKRRAYEDLDLDKVIEADEEMANAIGNLKELKTLSMDQRFSHSQAQPQYQPQYDERFSNPPQVSDPYLEYQQENINDWLQDHPYLNPESRKYDRSIADSVINFSTDFERKLIKAGRGNDLYSDEYFDVLNNYVDKLKRNSAKRAENVQNASRIGGVKKSFPAAKTTNKNQLTDIERSHAEMWNLPEDAWAKSKKHFLNQQKNYR